jgi:hypothetical protein
MGHVVLLGDSIFDNARYVPDQPAVIDQVRQALPRSWSATLLAIDGHVTAGVVNQLRGLPADASHLVVSAGGNDALGESSILGTEAETVEDALVLVHEVQTRFQRGYRAMLRALCAVGTPAGVCTVYDAIPGLGPAEKTALAGFNEIILREAFLAGLPLIDLRLVCDLPADFSHVSPIEPSMVGGAKIARVIAELATTHDFARRKSTIYI